MFLSPFQIQQPLLVKSVGIVESGLNHFAVGDSGASKGAYQVQAKHWGKVPKDLYGQTKQADDILTVLAKENKGNHLVAVERYNGLGYMAKRYQTKVIKKSMELYILEVV